jgi:hypothetical protein
MIILVPTDDGISVASDFDKANAFRYMNILEGYVKVDELRKKETDAFDALFSNSGKNGADCYGIIITQSIPGKSEEIIQKYNFDIYLTREHNISVAILDYLIRYLTVDSDHCCAP